MKNVRKITFLLCRNVIIVNLFHMQNFFDCVFYQKFVVNGRHIAALTFFFGNCLCLAGLAQIQARFKSKYYSLFNRSAADLLWFVEIVYSI